MKKILVTILLLAIFLSLTSCNEDNKGNQDEEGSGYFLVQYDYGNITKDEVTILIDGCLPFFDFNDYGINNVYPGDQLYIEYIGKPIMALSYPGQMFGIEVKNVILQDRTIKEVPEEEIKRDNQGYLTNILNNENMIEYIILDEELNYIPINEYNGTTIYSLHYNDTTINTPVNCYLAFDPTDILLNTTTIFGYYQSTEEEYNTFFNKYNMYNKERLGFPNLFFVLKILAKFHAFCSVTYNLVRAFTITRVFLVFLTQSYNTYKISRNVRFRKRRCFRLRRALRQAARCSS